MSRTVKMAIITILIMISYCFAAISDYVLIKQLGSTYYSLAMLMQNVAAFTAGVVAMAKNKGKQDES